MSVSSIGYYRIFTLNLRDSRIFTLDPTTIRIVDKEDRMKRFSRALKQIEENIVRADGTTKSRQTPQRD
jgi:PII-like signaling protein